jgi:hypothetical protein
VTPLLVPPVVVTVTCPVVAPAGTAQTICDADHELAAAAFPLKRTKDVPCVFPKTVPVILTCVPTWPEVGAMPVIVGGATVALATESGFLSPGIERTAAQRPMSRAIQTIKATDILRIGDLHMDCDLLLYGGSRQDVTVTQLLRGPSIRPRPPPADWRKKAPGFPGGFSTYISRRSYWGPDTSTYAPFLNWNMKVRYADWPGICCCGTATAVTTLASAFTLVIPTVNVAGL